MTEQKREHFRIMYPVGDRPRITIRNETFEIIDLSEMGLRIAVKDAAKWRSVTEPLQGTITFSDNEKVAVIGKILRATVSHLILQLSRGVPYSKVMAEQRRILQVHKTLK